jgi:putative oxidoreductase
MNPALRNAADLAGRILLAWLFLSSGLGKIANYSGTVSYMGMFGVPGFLLPPAIAVEVLAGLALIAGWQTRWAAFLLAGFTVVSAIFFHNNFADQNQMIHFWKNIALAGGLLFVVAHGAAGWALDARRSKIAKSGREAQFA